jgi:hypothetical protein
VFGPVKYFQPGLIFVGEAQAMLDSNTIQSLLFRVGSRPYIEILYQGGKACQEKPCILFGACTIKHYESVIYGKMTNFVVS